MAKLHGVPALVERLIEGASVGILVESDDTITYANNTYAGLLGYRDAQLLMGRPVEDLVMSEDAPRLREFSRLRISGQTAPCGYEFDARGRDGSVRLHASVFTSFVNGGAYITTVVRPVEEPSPAPDPLEGVLSPRERETMDMILAGKRIKEIALSLAISEKTVCTHRVRMFKKLNLESNHDLFRYGVAHQLLDWRG